MTPDSFSQRLHASLGQGLLMVAMYGSAAQAETRKGYRSAQVLVVCESLGMEELDQLAPIVSKWVAASNPTPLFFTRERLLNSAHVFPIELLDIKENHVILHGQDVLKSLPISQSNLQFQLEHELKLRLIQLREGYMLAGRSDSEVLDLMLRTLREFTVMLKAMLRFFETSVPLKRLDALKALGKHVDFEIAVFAELEAIRSGSGALPPNGAAIRTLFSRYLTAVERSADLVSRLGRRG